MPPPVIIYSNSCMYISLFLSPKCHRTLKMYNDLTVCGWLEYFPHCAATPAPSWCYPLTRSGKVRQWHWIKALRSNELITGGNAFSTEMKALFYYVSYTDKKSHYKGFHRGLFNTVLKHNYLLRVISIANWGWWTLIGYLTYNSKSIGLLARERLQNANYLIINI